MAHVLVIGASQGIGLETVKAALAAGHRVRAFARSAATMSLSDQGLERFPGDALNAADVTSALEGIDVVVQALGVPAKNLLGPVTLFSAATNVLVPAMEKAGVRRILAVTGFGTGDSRDAIGLLQRIPFRLVFGRAYDDKDAQEMRIRRSGLGLDLRPAGRPDARLGHGTLQGPDGARILAERPDFPRRRGPLHRRRDRRALLRAQGRRPRGLGRAPPKWMPFRRKRARRNEGRVVEEIRPIVPAPSVGDGSGSSVCFWRGVGRSRHSRRARLRPVAQGRKVCG